MSYDYQKTDNAFTQQPQPIFVVPTHELGNYTKGPEPGTRVYYPPSSDFRPPQPPPPPPHRSPAQSETEFSGLDDKRVRRLFVRKVFSILAFLLLITFGFLALTWFQPGIKTFVRQNPGLYFLSYALFLGTYICLACCKDVARRPGLNYVILGILNLSMTYMVCMITAYHNNENVLIAAGITVVVCVSVILFSMQSRYDFTKCIGPLFVASIAFLVFSIIMMIFSSKITVMIYGGLGAVLFSVFLAVDIQMIMGGRRYEISEEDYVFAAIMLYLDIVYIFIYILQLFSASTRD